jgi:hypothetical protein
MVYKLTKILVLSIVLSILVSCGGGGGGSTPAADAGGSDSGISLDDYTYTADSDGSAVEVDVTVTDNSSTLNKSADAVYYDSTTYTYDAANSDSDTLVLTGAGLVAPAVGQIVFGVNADGTTGYLRRVVSVTSNDGATMVLETENVSFQEAFPNSELNLSMNFSDAATGSGDTRASTEILNIDREISHQFYDGIKTVLDLSVSSDFNVDLDLRFGIDFIEEFETSINSDMSSTLVFDVNLPYELSKEFSKDFNPLFDKNFTVFISGFPVLINVKVVPVIGADLTLTGSSTFKYGYSFDTDFTAGFNYTRGTGITKIADYTYNSSNIGPAYTLEGAASAEAYARLQVMVSLYEVQVDIPVYGEFEIDGPGIGLDLGPKGAFNASATYNSDSDTTDCLLDLTVGISSTLTLDYGGFGDLIDVEDSEFELFSYDRSVWSTTECPFTGATSSLEGTVVDKNGSPLSSVTVTLTPEDEDAGEALTATTDGGGAYTFAEVSTGIYTIKFVKSGYVTVDGNTTIGESPAVYGQTTMAEEGNGEDGTINFSVADASNPTLAVANAQIMIREGDNDTQGEFVKRVYSDSVGAVSTTLEPGNYTAEVSKDSYETAYESFVITGGEASSKTVLLSAELDEDDDTASTGVGGEARVVLTWGVAPRDLDSHLTWGENHVAYYNMTVDEVSLDVDDTTSYGPETVTISDVDTATTYNYYVHNYSGESDMGASGAVVKLYYGGTTRTYNIPSGVGLYWNVFSIENGQVVAASASNALTSEPRDRAGKLIRTLEYLFEK